jgi:antitoxin (DNA-binding transcriptional repressor) of toxin-antitoxin stability system
MAFGKHANPDDDGVDDDLVASDSEAGDDELDGPFDIDDFDDPAAAAVARLDLGSVLIPMPEAGQVQVELTEQGVPSAVWVVTPNGRFTVAAYAAPKSSALWREVASELADSLRKDASEVRIEDGPWGREVVGAAPAGVVRFIGIDGYRWMIRCVVNGPQETIDALSGQAREALADTVVRRGETPMPVRTPLPVQLPEPMAQQLAAAAEQAAAQQATQQPPQPPPTEPVARRSEHGSAMQQLRTITGG